jgi:signal transduction histidine kinase
MPVLNIRRKILLGILLIALCLGSIAAVSYSNLNRIDGKVLHVGKVEELAGLILELRRHEKNMILHGLRDCMEEASVTMDTAGSLLREIESSPYSEPEQVNLVRTMSRELQGYRHILAESCSFRAQETGTTSPLRRLRDKGRLLSRTAKEVASLERDAILSINRELRAGLLLSIASVFVLLAGLVILVIKRIITPLGLLEEATRKVARGRFATMPVQGTHDEIRRVLEAFNTMVVELENRQDQLVRAQKLSSIGSLSSGIAHQLNNPLNNISTSGRILTEELQNHPATTDITYRMLHNIDTETMRARDIVRGLLDFCRPAELDIAPCPLSVTVDAAIQLAAGQLPSRIRILREIPESLTPLMDHQRMQEVFINLLINAGQAMGDDSGTITIRAMAEAGRALIEVCDTGSGIAPEILERIFDPFYSTKDVGYGTGLGLYVAYGIIQEHHGTVEVQSVQGKGTCFNITLPLAEADHE